jgi:hypothetical protein
MHQGHELLGQMVRLMTRLGEIVMLARALLVAVDAPVSPILPRPAREQRWKEKRTKGKA